MRRHAGADRFRLVHHPYMDMAGGDARIVGSGNLVPNRYSRFGGVPIRDAGDADRSRHVPGLLGEGQHMRRHYTFA